MAVSFLTGHDALGLTSLYLECSYRFPDTPTSPDERSVGTCSVVSVEFHRSATRFPVARDVKLQPGSTLSQRDVYQPVSPFGVPPANRPKRGLPGSNPQSIVKQRVAGSSPTQSTEQRPANIDVNLVAVV